MKQTDTPPCAQAPIGVCTVKRDRAALTVLNANPRFSEMVGRAAKGRLLDNLLVCKDGAELCRKLKSPNPPARAIVQLGKSWGKVFIEADEATYTLYLADISDLKEEAQAADALAEQKSNFLATMSHEIRTPMQSVYGLLEMIELEQPPADILTMVRTAKQSASGLLEILDGVLDFAKMDADKMELDLFEVPVRMLCRGIIEALEVKVSGKDVELKDSVDQDVPFVIVGDPKRLRQILINLMGNALKFTKDGSVTIRVTKQVRHIAQPAKGVALRFEVIDTGIGMSADAVQRMFQPFSQADNSTSRKYGGTGLGLSICKKLVDMMGGAIGVESVEGEGSTFWFEIPTEEVDVDAQVLSLPDLAGVSVLSVEDHPLGAKEIQKTLRSMGANVEHCGNIADAVELLRRRPFDVGIFDQGLPDGLGIDLIRQTIELRPFMGLIMYTARDDAGLQHTLQTLGVTYLTKPASRVGLGEAVHDAAAKVSKMTIGAGSTRLLIAEDTESVRDVLRRQLDKLGVDATFVVDGEQALEAVRSGKYGILFSDLHMPKMDGYELTRRIRSDDEKQGRHFPIVALTADVQMAQRQIYMEHGFDECLLKPVSLGHFRRLLIRWGLLCDDAPATLPDTAPAPEAMTEEAAPPADAPPAPIPSVIDRKAVESQMGAFDADVIEMLRMFVDMTEPLVNKIRDTHDRSDYRNLAEHAHSLKGAARSACLPRLGELASRLQDEAQAHKDCRQLVRDIQQAFADAKQEIASL